MYKILLSCLPLLLACTMDNGNSPNDQKNETAATETIPQEEVTNRTQVVNPRLQAVKWSGIKEMTDETFKKDVLASSALTLVDFNAEWCGPCKMLEPVLAQLVKEYDGRINFASVNVDECPRAARYYNVSSIPFLAFYQNAQQGNTIIGLQPYETLKKMIDEELKKP